MSETLSKAVPATRQAVSTLNATSAVPLRMPAASPDQRRVEPIKPAVHEVEKAVYAYLQAIRSLNKTRVTPEAVASALGISTMMALAALTNLQHKGVKRAK
jgi:hypothetical protein